MHTELALEVGDVAAVAIHSLDRAAAHELLHARGFAPVPLEMMDDA